MDKDQGYAAWLRRLCRQHAADNRLFIEAVLHYYLAGDRLARSAEAFRRLEKYAPSLHPILSV